MTRSMLLISALLFIREFSIAQSNSIEKGLDSIFGTFSQSEPGCAVLVAKGDKILYEKGFGSADLELNVDMTPGMVFKLASITKQFTAVAILQLHEQGKISLKDSIQKFIPDYPLHSNPITIENLLTHTSGIPDYMQIDYRSQNMERWDFSPRQLIDSFKNYPLQFAPGSKYAYSNSGYYLLGYIIEMVSGKKYEDYLQERILNPLGLSHTYFDRDGGIIPGRVNGYRREGSEFRNADYWSPSIAYAAGGLLSNTEDLYKWFRGLLANKLIKKETLEKAFTPFKLSGGSFTNYGYGWQVFSTGRNQSIEHGGHMNGFITSLVYYPEQEIFITLLFNSEDAPKDEMSTKISELVLGVSLHKEVKQSLNNLVEYAGTYRLATDKERTIEIVLEGEKLMARIPGQATFEIVFEEESKFGFKNVKEISGTFIKENGKVTKMVIEQNGRFVWEKN